MPLTSPLPSTQVARTGRRRARRRLPRLRRRRPVGARPATPSAAASPRRSACGEPPLGRRGRRHRLRRSPCRRPPSGAWRASPTWSRWPSATPRRAPSCRGARPPTRSPASSTAASSRSASPRRSPGRGATAATSRWPCSTSTCFKDVNDLHGHVVGDAVLREAALRLASRAREGDVHRPARRRGVRLADARDRRDGGLAGHRAGPRGHGGGPVPGRRPGHGVRRRLRPRPRRPRSTLYRQADVALYWAKRHGRDVVFLYSARGHGRRSDGEERAAELRRGQTFQSIRVLARSVDAKDPSTRRHSERVAGLADGARRGPGLAPGADGAAARGRPRPRRGQDRGLRHDPLQARRPDRGARWSRCACTRRSAPRCSPTCSRPSRPRGCAPTTSAGTARATPTGWRASPIPEGARILHLADAWDVMTSNRPYVPPLAPDGRPGRVPAAGRRRSSGRRPSAPWRSSAASGGLDAAVLERRALLERL